MRRENFAAAAGVEGGYAGFSAEARGSHNSDNRNEFSTKSVTSELHFSGGKLPTRKGEAHQVETQLAANSPSEMKYVRDAWLAQIVKEPDTQQEIKMAIRPWTDLIEVQQVLQSLTSEDADGIRRMFAQPLPLPEILRAMNYQYLGLRRIDAEIMILYDMLDSPSYKEYLIANNKEITEARDKLDKLRAELDASTMLFNGWDSAALAEIANKYQQVGFDGDGHLDQVTMEVVVNNVKEDKIVFGARDLEQKVDKFDNEWRPPTLCTCKPEFKNGGVDSNDVFHPCSCGNIFQRDECKDEDWCDWDLYGQEAQQTQQSQAST